MPSMVGIWIPDSPGIQMVESSGNDKWSCFLILFEWGPVVLNGCYFVPGVHFIKLKLHFWRFKLIPGLLQNGHNSNCKIQNCGHSNSEFWKFLVIKCIEFKSQMYSDEDAIWIPDKCIWYSGHACKSEGQIINVTTLLY